MWGRAHLLQHFTCVRDLAWPLSAGITLWLTVLYYRRALVATSFKESTQVNPASCFLIACAVLQVSLALICSTITIISFSGNHHNVSLSLSKYKLWVDAIHKFSTSIPLQMRIDCVSCSGASGTIMPFQPWQQRGTGTIYSESRTITDSGYLHRGTVTFMIALIVDAVCPTTVQNNCTGQVNNFTVAKVLLSLAMCFTIARFGFFMLHLRRISQALQRAEPA